jgi:hypothetical protein
MILIKMKKFSLKIFSNKAVAVFRKSTVGTLCIIVVSLFILSAGCADNGKENDINTVGVKGTIIGYNKCREYEKNDQPIAVGIFMCTEKNDTLLAYNIPRSTCVYYWI